MDFLPYGRQLIEDDDVAAVTAALRSDFLTTGPRVEAFESAAAEAVGARYGIACSSGTAALHLSMLALGVGPGDAVIVPAVTFAATANCVRFRGAEVVFADVDPDTGLMTRETYHAAVAHAWRRLVVTIPVHLSGNAVDLKTFPTPLVEDACHALGTTMHGERVGSCRHSLMSCFSLHPVKTITSAEGGMVTTNDADLAERLRLLRNHGIENGEMQALGWNYRLPDVLCALGISQLTKLERFVARRRALADLYRMLLEGYAPLIRSVPVPAGCDPAPHLFVVLIDFEALEVNRAEVMADLKTRGIGTQVHYMPVPRHPYYRALYGDLDLPGADAYYARCLSLPLHPGMANTDPERVVEALADVLGLLHHRPAKRLASG